LWTKETPPSHKIPKEQPIIPHVMQTSEAQRRTNNLLMMNLGKPPLPSNKPYHRPLNYHEYVKDSNPYVHVRVLKVAIRVNGETKDVEIVNLFSFTFKDIVCD